MIEMDARAHIEVAARLCEIDRPVLSRTLQSLLNQFDRPEPAYAQTPAEALDSVEQIATTLLDDIASERRRAGLTEEPFKSLFDTSANL